MESPLIQLDSIANATVHKLTVTRDGVYTGVKTSGASGIAVQQLGDLDGGTAFVHTGILEAGPAQRISPGWVVSVTVPAAFVSFSIVGAGPKANATIGIMVQR